MADHPIPPELWEPLVEFLRAKRTGQVVLHVNEGEVLVAMYQDVRRRRRRRATLAEQSSSPGDRDTASPSRALVPPGDPCLDET